MCTAAAWKPGNFYLGRTLDNHCGYGEAVVLTPRNFPLDFGAAGCSQTHYAMLGMAAVMEGYPLYYDAMNEKGLAMAGLNFVGNAVFQKPAPGQINIPQFAFLPWLLCQCATVAEARDLLANTRLTDTPFSPEFPAAQLHWILGDEAETIVIESTADGLHMYDNPAGVLANNPPFPEQLRNLARYMHLSNRAPVNRLFPKVPLVADSLGMGAIGLPGDLSSPSRFVRIAFTQAHTLPGATEEENITRFFRIMNSVNQVKGCSDLGDGAYEITLYTSCCSASTGVYYYTTEHNTQITGVDMHRCNLDSDTLQSFPLLKKPGILLQNG